MDVEFSRPTVTLLITLLLLFVVDQIFRGYASHLSRGRSAIEPRGPTAHSPQLPCLPRKGRRRRDPSAHAPILRHPCRSLGRRMVRQALTMPLSFSYPIGAAVPASDEGVRGAPWPERGLAGVPPARERFAEPLPTRLTM